MRCYEGQDVDFFVNLRNNWELYCRYPADKTWRHQKLQPVSSINYYRDIEGSRINKMKRKDLYLGQRPKNRINPWACLPLFYATGSRFIKLEKAKPHGFKCAEFPLNIQQARDRAVEVEIEERKQEKIDYIREQFKLACSEVVKPEVVESEE